MYFANSSENKHAYETSSFPPMIHQMDRREMAGDVTLADCDCDSSAYSSTVRLCILCPADSLVSIILELST